MTFHNSIFPIPPSLLSTIISGFDVLYSILLGFDVDVLLY